VRRAAAAALAALALQGCAWWRSVDLWPFGGPEPTASPDLSQGVEVVESEAIVAFYERASAFYARLAGRRFNTLTTYRDPKLREFFRSDTAHADYYAAFASALREAYFEKNEPVSLEVVEVRIEGPGAALVLTRIVGENALPLRWWETVLEREDRWERVDGVWWLVPGRI
jgi:hypothetical protein